MSKEARILELQQEIYDINLRRYSEIMCVEERLELKEQSKKRRMELARLEGK